MALIHGSPSSIQSLRPLGGVLRMLGSAAAVGAARRAARFAPAAAACAAARIAPAAAPFAPLSLRMRGSYAALRHGRGFQGANGAPLQFSRSFSSSSRKMEAATGRKMEAAPGRKMEAAADLDSQDAVPQSPDGMPEAADTLSEDAPRAEDMVAALEEQIADLVEKNEELKDRLLRQMAETENTRERYRREVEAAKTFAISKFALGMLEIADNLDRAVAAAKPSGDEPRSALLEGVLMTQRQLEKQLESFGVEKMNALGQPFDPRLHEALFELPEPDKTPGTVVQIVKEGYTLHSRVLRAAHVGISTA